MKNLLLLVAAIFLSLNLAWAQSRVSGTVTDENGEPIEGVTVQVKGTTVGIFTDGQGKYTLNVPEKGEILVFSFIGKSNQEIAIDGRTSIDIEMSSDELFLDEVVVTALGISRDKKALGYSVQDVKGEDLEKARDGNVVNTLSGKIAGVQITSSSGNVGSSSRIVIRGNASIGGNNQPLFVVNGVPIDNGTYYNDQGYGGVDYGNAAMDINPEDIESVSVLKGPNAAALYGSRAANGVVLITTKSGKNAQKGLGITYSGNFGFSNPLILPNYQNEFGQGSGQQFNYVDGNYGGLNDGVDESWGPAFNTSINENDGIDNDGDGQVDEAGEGQLLDQYQGAQQPWVPQPDNIKDLFQTGVSITNNVSISANSEKVYSRLSFTNMNQTGMVPNTDLRRTSFNVSFGANLSDKLSTEGNVTYTQTASDNRPGTGYAGDNIMQQTIWSGRQIDINDLRENWQTRDEFGRNYNWNHSYQNNPFFTLYKNVKPQRRDRITGFYAIKYQLTDWLRIKGRVGDDLYRENRKRIFAKETKDYPNGRFEEDNFFVNELNADVLLTGDFNLGDDLQLTVNAGANHLVRRYERNSVTVQALTVPEIYNVSNANGNPINSAFVSDKVINSVYGMASLSFKDFLYLDVTGRNDWSSTLPVDNNSYFYPSVNLGFVLSDAVALPGFIDFAKIRGGWAKVGSDTDPYQLNAVYGANTAWNGVPSFTLSNQLAPANLTPEFTTSIEIGAELKFFQNRLGLDVTYYQAATDNQILAVDAAPSTGFTSQLINAGTIDNKGIEAMLNITPVRSTNFSWDIFVNFAKNSSEVRDLPEGVDAIRLGRYWSLDLEAREGQPYGNFYGFSATYDDAGNLMLSGGLPIREATPSVLGNITPDWVGGFRNSFRYKNVNLSFLLDVRKGSDIFSMTYMFGRYAGVLEESLEGRMTADEIKNGYVYEGVDADNGGPNTTPMDAETWNVFYYQSIGGHDRSVFDGSFIKLREVILGIDLPSSIISKTPFGKLSVGAYGRNLALLLSNVPHIDPETAFGNGNNIMGFEFGQTPTARTIGFTVDAKF